MVRHHMSSDLPNRDQVRQYCQDKLMTRILEANRYESMSLLLKQLITLYRI